MYESRYWRMLERQSGLAHKYVYYQRLLKDGKYYNNHSNKTKGDKLISLYNNINKEFSSLKENVKEINYGVAGLRILAKRENEKEKNLLKYIFGYDGLKMELEDVESTKKFIEVFNTCLSTKELFERNRELLKSRLDTKRTFSYFPGYFATAFEDVWGNGGLREEFIKCLTEGGDYQGAINNYIEEILRLAVEKMFDEAESETRNDAHKDAYKKFLSDIGSLKDKNSFVSQLYDIYGIKDFIERISEQLKNSQGWLSEKRGKKKKHTHVYDKVLSDVAVGMDIKSGSTAEAVAALIGNNLEIKNNGNGISITATRVGQINAKPDVILTFNVNPEPILQILNEREENSRAGNIAAFEKISEHLRNIDQGYVVYQSAKNYIPHSIRDGGFSAGKELTAEKLIPILQKIDKNANTLIGALINTGLGAIGATQENKDEIVHTLMGDIAIMLFDDYQTIGNKVDKGASVIHLLDLNGIYIPMSFFLELSAKAICETVEKVRNRTIKVSFSAPEIKFPERKDQRKWEAENPGKSAWQAQKQEALTETKVTYSFLRNFQDIIEQYL